MNGNNFSTKLHKKKLGGEICIAKKCKDPADFAGFCGHDVFCLKHAKERVSIAWKKIQCPTFLCVDKIHRRSRMLRSRTV